MTTADAIGMRQWAPYPVELRELVTACDYKQGWRFYLRDTERDPESTHGGSAGGLTLHILVESPDSHKPEVLTSTLFLYEVPAATYNRQSWTRWLFDRIRDTERHESMEFFKIAGVNPFPPLHAPGDDPYVIHDWATVEQVETNWRGVRTGG